MNSPQSNLFGQIDVTQSLAESYAPPAGVDAYQARVLQLLSQINDTQSHQNRLLEGLLERMSALVNQNAAAQQQKAMELQKWQSDNPLLTDECRDALESLSKVHSEFMESFASEISEKKEDLIDNEFALAEFVDKYGPRLIHLNSMMQFLSHLSAQVKMAKRVAPPNP